MLSLWNILLALLISFIQAAIVYACLSWDSVYMNQPGLSRILLFHFLICIPLGLLFQYLLINLITRSDMLVQGVRRYYSMKIWLVASVIVTVISLAMAWMHNTFLSVASFVIAMYVYFSMLYTYYGNNAEYHMWYSAIFAFVIFMLFLGDFAVLDSFYALFDEALGVTWYGMPPTQFLDVWKTLPNASAWPDSGISLGFGWGTNLQLKGSPQNLWSGGYIVAIFVASLTALWAFYLEWKTDAAKLNKSSDYDILLSPKGDGLENIMRFFAAAQDEVLQNKSMGIANNDALNEWIHGEGADAFLRNITQHEKREHVYAAIVNQPVQIPGRAVAGIGPKRHFV